MKFALDFCCASMAVFRILSRRLVLVDLNETKSRPWSLTVRRQYSRIFSEKSSLRYRQYNHSHQRIYIGTNLLKSQQQLTTTPTRQKNTIPTSSTFVNTDVAGATNQDVARDTLDLSFNDHQAAYRSYTTGEIIRAWFVYQLCGIQYLVDNNRKVRGLFFQCFHVFSNFYTCVFFSAYEIWT